MYKMLIADDEQIVLDSLKYIISKNFSNEIQLEVAHSGREAIEKAELHIPDIIFMDINMPGINGIEAIRELRGKLKSTVFIILTAFDQFDFAKDALKLGVTEYLLKPVNREKIISTIRKSIESIDSERVRRKKELDLKEKFEHILPILENGFIYSMLFFEDNSWEISNYKNIFEIEEDAGYIMTIEFAQILEQGEMINRIGLSMKGQTFYPYLRDILKGRCKCFVGPNILNRVIVYIPVTSGTEEYKQRLGAVSIAEYVYDQISEKADVDFFIGIGRNYIGFDNIYRSYEESLRAIRYAQEKGFYHIMDIPVEKEMLEKYPIQKEKLMLERVALGDTEISLQSFNYIFEWLNSTYINDVDKIKAKLLELVILIMRIATEYNIYGQYTNSIENIRELQAINNLSELKLCCSQKIEFVTKGIYDCREKKVNILITKALSYIRENFKNDITLEDVSQYVNISPHYFSKLFKDETGENFIDFLTNLRISTAKELIKNSVMSVKEICYEIGYGDPNYFSRIFKKIVGLTPTEYRDSIITRVKDGAS